MNLSAAASSSWVETPGRIFPASRFIVRTSTAPAAAMRSISWGLFLMITTSVLALFGPGGGSDVLFKPQRGDHGPDVVVHVGRAAGSVDPAHESLPIVEVDQGLGLLVIDAQAVAHDVGLVVVALDEPRAVLVADA